MNVVVYIAVSDRSCLYCCVIVIVVIVVVADRFNLAPINKSYDVGVKTDLITANPTQSNKGYILYQYT